jgi:hypothetical protein
MHLLQGKISQAMHAHQAQSRCEEYKRENANLARELSVRDDTIRDMSGAFDRARADKEEFENQMLARHTTCAQIRSDLDRAHWDFARLMLGKERELEECQARCFALTSTNRRLTAQLAHAQVSGAGECGDMWVARLHENNTFGLHHISSRTHHSPHIDTLSKLTPIAEMDEVVDAWAERHRAVKPDAL